MEPQLSPFPYEEIMVAIERIQGDLSAIVILQTPDGGTTYLRHKISKGETAALLREAYSSLPPQEEKENV